MKKLLSLTSFLFLFGCATNTVDLDKASTVKPGMSKSEIVAMFGFEPTVVNKFHTRDGYRTIMTWIEYPTLNSNNKKIVSFEFDENDRVADARQDLLDEEKKTFAEIGIK